jgi:VWFA-related protein
VDAAVTDAGGLAVTSLAAADFELLAGGKPVPIASFSYVTQSPRRLVLLVDDAGLSRQGVDRVRNALTGFVTGQMGPSDEAAILRTRAGSGVLEAITSDQRVLRDAIAQIRVDPSQGAAGKAHEEFVLAGMAVTLRRALAGLAAVPGRKAIVLISENLALARQHADLFAPFASLAADASAVFYTVDLRDSGASVELDTLMLTGDTGGLDLGSELSTGLARVLRDQEGYYLLGYHAEDEGASILYGRGEASLPRVRIGNAALLVRWRSSPLGAGTPERDFRARTPAQELSSAINSPFAGGAIRVQVTPIFDNTLKFGPMVTALVWMDAHDLTFTHQLNGLHKASGAVVVSAFDSSGVSAGQTSLSVAVQLTGEQYQKALQHGLLCQTQLPMHAPGTYQVRAAMRDETSSRMGTASQLVQAPDLTSGALTLSGISIRGKDSTTLDDGPARRIFAPGEKLSYIYQILNPWSGPQKPEELEIRLRLFRDDVEVFRGAPQILPAKTMEDPKRCTMAGELELGAKLAAGHYWLEVAVAAGQSEKPRQAQQWIDFEVRP